jgi:AcrR family transcriptional regulator
LSTNAAHHQLRTHARARHRGTPVLRRGCARGRRRPNHRRGRGRQATFYHHFPAKDELVREPKYRGCPFVNAAAEYPDPDHPVRQAIAEHRRWFRELLRDLLVADGHPDADRTADIMVALKDGLLVAADLDDPAHRSLIRDAVTRLLDAEAGTSADHR